MSISISHANSAERIQVVTTIPTLKDMVINVGGEKVEVVSLLKGGEDLHTFDPRPSHTRAVAKADVAVKIGIGLDNWVDRIVSASGNKGILLIQASDGVHIIGNNDYSSSHSHGNPHVWLDPRNTEIIVRNIYQSLAAAYPEDAGYFLKRMDRYLAELALLEREMEESLSQIKDRRVVTYHPGWDYLLRRFQIKEIMSIEKSPGREPSAKEIALAIDTIRKSGVKLIISEPEAHRRIVNIVAGEGGAGVAILAPEIGSLPGINTYLDLIRYNVLEIVRGLK